MHFDDRLATVLRHRATGEFAVRTQYRQLLDLLGEPPRGRDESLEAAAFLRLEELAKTVPLEHRTRIVAEGGTRIRNPALVAYLGEAEPDVAAAALARASLSGADWSHIIPELPIRARGFLRHRQSLPEEATAILDRLGVQDRVLPNATIPSPQTNEAKGSEDVKETDEPTEPPSIDKPKEKPGIRELVQRIEAYSRARETRDASTTELAEDAPLLPLGENAGLSDRNKIIAFSFRTDSKGRIDWADPEVAPMIVGTVLGQDLRAVPGLGRAVRDRLPISNALAELEGAGAIAGVWAVDATPRFLSADGRFAGFIGRFRRVTEDSAQARAKAEEDRVRQLLHELRTPVNAIQGFAEVIQQQLFGNTPHEYRALAASIAGDSARMLAGFDELDRLVRLESASQAPETGECDFFAIAMRQVDQLQTVLSPRVARFDVAKPAGVALVPISQSDGEMLAWRILGAIASGMSAGEEIRLILDNEDGQLAMRVALPANLSKVDNIFSTENRLSNNTVSAGIFGTGFALRLARAEARSMGGDLARVDENLMLNLPLLTTAESEPSPEPTPDRATG